MAQSAKRALLQGISPNITDKRFEICTDPVRLGHGSSCSIIIIDPKISRDHAEIHFQDGIFFITDLGSTHGTWVDGVDVQQARLADGSRIRLGDSELIFNVVQDAIPTMMVPDSGSPRGPGELEWSC